MEAELKPPKIVKCPVHAQDLIKGKEYRVKKVIQPTSNYGWGFYIDDESGFQLTCLEKKDSHIHGFNWIIVEREK